MFETVFDEITWDIHGSKPFSSISCYRDLVGPMFDIAYASLLSELAERGLLSSTMVVATGRPPDRASVLKRVTFTIHLDGLSPYPALCRVPDYAEYCGERQ